jgi:hypothetical protein
MKAEKMDNAKYHRKIYIAEKVHEQNYLRICQDFIAYAHASLRIGLRRFELNIVCGGGGGG